MKAVEKIVPWKDMRMYAILVSLIVTWVGYWWEPIKTMVTPEATNTFILAIMGWAAMKENRKPALK